MTDNTLPPKVYLGDGAYAECDGYHIMLTTENGISTTNRIALEPEVFETLLGYARRVAAFAPENHIWRRASR